ncbi:MAG: DUF4010 domain-containing protein [Candidatus Binatia bacterium]
MAPPAPGLTSILPGAGGGGRQCVLLAVQLAHERWGSVGLLVSGAVLGLTDVDALTISMARSAVLGAAGETAARALAMGMLANTVLKFGVALVVGRARFRRLVTGGLAAIAAAAAASIAFFR